MPKETAPGERRVALVPDAVARLPEGIDVLVEGGAGTAASFADEAYAEAGATVVDDPYDADVVVKIRKPDDSEIERLREGTVLIGLLEPLTDPDRLARLADRGVTALAMESIPRISRAQAMDALSSQATAAGYKAVVKADEPLPIF